MSIVERYTDPSKPGAFEALSGFQRNNKHFVRGEVLNKLKGLDSVTLHKPVRKKFERNKFISNGIDDIWQSDLLDVSKIKYVNSHYSFILVCVDIFSKYAFAAPLKNKTAAETKKGFEKILAQGRKPNKIHVDEGNEYKGDCVKYLKELGIEIYSTHSQVKAGIAERFIKSLKSRMQRMFTFNNNKKFVEALPKLIESYNSSYHSSIKTSPKNVTEANSAKIRKNLYGDYRDQIVIFHFKIGDYVRTRIEKSIFEKGYTPGWDKEIYIVDQILPRVPAVYKIKTLDGTQVLGSYYKEELQKVRNAGFDTFQVLEESGEKILVKQLNSQDQSESWVDRSQFLE